MEQWGVLEDRFFSFIFWLGLYEKKEQSAVSFGLARGERRVEAEFR